MAGNLKRTKLRHSYMRLQSSWQGAALALRCLTGDERASVEQAHAGRVFADFLLGQSVAKFVRELTYFSDRVEEPPARRVDYSIALRPMTNVARHYGFPSRPYHRTPEVVLT